MALNIKKYIPLTIKNKLIYFLSNNRKYINLYKKEEKKIVVALAANYGNLGDVAITYAQTKFLDENFKGYKILEVPIDQTYTNMKALKKVIGKEDIITIIGGGNFGNIYSDIEEARQFFIRKFPKNKIVCFPQTIDFSDNKEGKKSLKKAKRVYEKHKDLTLFAREENSFKIMKENFRKNKVYLVPDIVLSLNKQEPKKEREKITICFRNDKENKMSNSKKEQLIEDLQNEYKDKIIMQDTHIGNIKISQKEREKYLEEIWTIFRKSKIVVTDRLHGMIFCAITGTPCIAFPNSNGKIEATYKKWLQDTTPYIKLGTDIAKENVKQQIYKLVEENKETKIIEKKEEYTELLQVLSE